jgi:regulator-associated protein of mTOR
LLCFFQFQRGLVDMSKESILLIPCGANEQLPMNPEFPADLFTSCLTTPIKIALRWCAFYAETCFLCVKLSSFRCVVCDSLKFGLLSPQIRFASRSTLTHVTPDMIDKIPGKLNDRKTPLGELNWIFTAITDTIAWNVLPRGNILCLH